MKILSFGLMCCRKAAAAAHSRDCGEPSSWAWRMTTSVALLLFHSGAVLFVGEAEPVGPSQQPEFSGSAVDFRGNF